MCTVMTLGSVSCLFFFVFLPYIDILLFVFISCSFLQLLAKQYRSIIAPLKSHILSHYLIYPLTTKSFGHHRWFLNQFSPFSPVLHCPLGLAELQACPFPYAVFPSLSLSALSSSPFHCALQDGLARPDERETWPYHWSLRLFTIVRRSSCGPIPCWIFGTDFLVGNMVFVWDA